MKEIFVAQIIEGKPYLTAVQVAAWLVQKGNRNYYQVLSQTAVLGDPGIGRVLSYLPVTDTRIFHNVKEPVDWLNYKLKLDMEVVTVIEAGSLVNIIRLPETLEVKYDETVFIQANDRTL